MSSLDDFLEEYGLDDYDWSDLPSSDDFGTSYDDYDYGSSDFPSSGTDFGNSNDDDYGSSDSPWSDSDFGTSYDNDDHASSDFPWSDADSGSSNDDDVYSYDPSNFDSSGYGSQTVDSCATDVAFKTRGPRVDLAFDVIFLVLFLAMGVIMLIGFLRSKQKGASLRKWFLFPVSLFFAILALLLDMIILILSQCLIMSSDKHQLARVAVEWFGGITIFTLMVLILLPICLKLQHGGGKIATLTLILHSIWLVICGIFLLVSLAINARIQDAAYRTFDRIDPDLHEAARDVTMAYHVFLFLAALLASANMFFALFRKSNLRKGTTLLAIPALIITTVGLTTVQMACFADRLYGDMHRSPSYLEKSRDAATFIGRMFYAAAFLVALVLAGVRQPTEESVAPVAPVAPMVQSGVQEIPQAQYPPQPQGQYQPPAAPGATYASV